MNPAEIPIHGKNLSEEELQKARQSVEESFLEGTKVEEGEIEKSKEILSYIKRINEYLNAELSSLGLPGVTLDPRRIHILPRENFKIRYGYDDEETTGFYDQTTGGAYIDGDVPKGILLANLLHEVIHQISFKDFLWDPEDAQFFDKRKGYQDDRISEENHGHFYGFNEAVIECIVEKIFIKHADELKGEFSLTEHDFEPKNFSYRGNIDIMNIVMNKVALHKGEDQEMVWRRFERGLFTGEMMHLRDIDDACGEGSLRILAAFVSPGGNQLIKEEKIIADMKEYFETTEDTKKQNIARHILSERERLRYERFRNLLAKERDERKRKK